MSEHTTEAKTEPVEPTATAPGPNAGDETQPPELGDSGRKALDAERQARKAAEQRAREAEQRAASIEQEQARRTVAAEKGLTDAQMRFVTGETAEELAANADELLAAFAPEPDTTRRRPQERLRPGAAPGSEPPADMGNVADQIIRGW